jgi:hypothetical protein
MKPPERWLVLACFLEQRTRVPVLNVRCWKRSGSKSIGRNGRVRFQVLEAPRHRPDGRGIKHV